MAGALRGGGGGVLAYGGGSVAGQLSDGFPGAGVINEVLAGCRGGHQRGGAGVVQGAGQAAGDPVQVRAIASSAKTGSSRPASLRWWRR